MTDSNPPKPKRRWYQFSLRTLLVVLVVGGSVLGLIVARMNEARTNQERVPAIMNAVAEIQKLGGIVHSGYKELRPQTWLEKLLHDPGGPDNPVRVLNVSNVELRGAHVTDADLKHLKGLSNLKDLALDGTNVTGEGLIHLEGLTELITLYLTSTNVTDAGLEHLKGLMDLEILSLSGTEVTASGVKKLQQALPNCKIGHDFE